jgi:hypothetical protein
MIMYEDWSGKFAKPYRDLWLIRFVMPVTIAANSLAIRLPATVTANKILPVRAVMVYSPAIESFGRVNPYANERFSVCFAWWTALVYRLGR